MELSPKQQKRIQKLQKFSQDKDLATLENLLEIDEKIDEVKTNIDTKFSSLQEELKKKLESELVLEIDREELKGDDGYTPIKDVDYFDGKDYVLTSKDKKEIAESIKVPVVEKVIEKTEVIHETPIVTEVVREVAVKDDGKEIITKINEDKTTLIKKEKIEGLDETFKNNHDDLLNRAVSIVDNRTSFLINKVSNLSDKVANMGGGGGGTWGSITGTLSDQTDLQTALNDKYDASNPSGFISNISGQDLSTADNTTSQFITLADVPAEADTLQSVTDRGAVTTNSIEAPSFVVTGGTSSEFLKADGSVDSNTYVTGTPWTSEGYLTDISGQDLSLADNTTSQFITLADVDLSGYVPYTGANANVDLGMNRLSLNGVLAGTIYRALAVNTATTGSGRSIPLAVTHDDPSTTLTGNISGMNLSNESTTNNSYSGLMFSTRDTGGTALVNAFIHAVHTDHTPNAMSSDIAFGTRNAGTLSGGMFYRADGRLYIERDNLGPNNITHHLLELKAHNTNTGNNFGAGIRFMNQEVIGTTPWEMGFISIGRSGHDQSGRYNRWLSSVGTSRNVYYQNPDGSVVHTNFGVSNGYSLIGNLNGGNFFATTNTNVHAQAVAGFEANANASRKFGLYAPSSIHTNMGAGFTNTAVLRSQVYPTLAIINEQSGGELHFRIGGNLVANNRFVINNTGVDVLSGDIALLIGANDSSSARSNNTQKFGRIASYHYVNAEEPVGIVFANSAETLTTLNYGGGSSLFNSAMLHRWWTATDTTTQTGTLTATLNSTGDFELLLNGGGVIIQSPDEAKWRIVVDNSGVLSTVSV
jgi:hypothetical protein